MNREDVALQPPDPSRDYSDLPGVSIAVRARVARSHRVDRGAWFFASHEAGTVGGGRFDLTEPHGTIYTADSIPVAVWERLGPNYLGAEAVPASVADQFVISILHLPAGTCANTDHQNIRDFGITRELASAGVYALTQEWAETFKAAGFDGVRYGARFSPDTHSNVWAVFGEMGERTDWDVDDQVHGRDACAESGLKILSVPWSVETAEPVRIAEDS